MDLFEVLRDDVNLNTGRIDASHRWSLPGVICHACGSTWGNVGLEYPSVNLSKLPNEKEYRRARAVPLGEFTRLREPIVRLMGREALLLPGTEFGPLEGKGKGKFTADFAWVNAWTLLATAKGLEKLSEEVPGLKGFHPQIKFTSVAAPTLLELELEPHGELVLPAFDNGELPCKVCERDPRGLPEEIIITKSSIPKNRHLFRARNFTTLLLATDRFVKVVGDSGLVGLSFEKVKIL